MNTFARLSSPSLIPACPRLPVLGDLLPGTIVRDLALVTGFAAFVGVASQFVIPLPFTPVPITGQTFAVLLGGAVVGWRRSLIAMVLYVAAGIAGMPWFPPGQAGLHILAAPVFGYLLSYPLAAAVVGRLARCGMDRTVGRTLLTMALGNLTIYAIGVPWLAVSLHVGAVRALELGMLPFIIGDTIKLLAAAAILPGTWRLGGRLGVVHTEN